MRKIETWIKQFITDRNLLVLREVGSNKALNVSYTEYGLKWTMDNYGKLVYYDNARLTHVRNSNIWIPKILGDTSKKSPKVYVEKFIPTDQKSIPAQVAEFIVCNKALRLLYSNNE